MIDSITRLIRRLLGITAFRYLIAGGATFVVNFGSMAVMLYVLGWKDMTGTFLTRFGPSLWLMQTMEWSEGLLIYNIAHAIGTELSFLFAFHVHNWWTWENADQGSYWSKIVHFHLTTGTTFTIRQVSFHLLISRLDWHWVPATLLPLVVAIMINYVVYNFFIFRERENESGERKPGKSPS